MAKDFSGLVAALESAGADGYLLDADGSTANQSYLSGFSAPDPFLTLFTPDETAILTSPLEYSRAREESRADTVRRWGDYDYRDKRDTHGQDRARELVLGEFLAEFGVESVLTDRRFPLYTADGIRREGHEVQADLEDAIEGLRATKSAAEIDHVQAAQRANEAAMAAAADLMTAATVGPDDVLQLEGDPLTSERLKSEIERTLLDRGYAMDQTIVASGPDGALPHERGSGPIAVDEPVIVDIFPRSKETGYHADMTRTFLRGEPDPEIRTFYDLTQEAKAAAIDAVEPGVTGEAVHDAVCDVYEDAGYPTLRSDESTETGFIHSTGHGVGLEVHEQPSIGPGGEPLEPGNVITIEPGLYDPAVGGVRIEDLLVVTEDGARNLTDYPEQLVL